MLKELHSNHLLTEEKMQILENSKQTWTYVFAAGKICAFFGPAKADKHWGKKSISSG